MTQMRRKKLSHYMASLPERAVRAMAAGVGGLLNEVAELVIPDAVRRTHLYQATVDRLLRITVELVGGVRDVYPPDEVNVGELAVRKAAGNVIELASILTMGWSPLWLLAVAADVTGGTRTYLRALVAEMQRKRVLPTGVEITSVEELLDALEQTSGTVADTIDVPPLDVQEMRASWQMLKAKVSELPDDSGLASLFAALQRTAEQEGRSLLSVSALIGAGAVRTGIQMGSTYIFDYYRESLQTIASEGLPAYMKRVARPYVTAARGHFNPKHVTFTERLLQRLRGS